MRIPLTFHNNTIYLITSESYKVTGFLESINSEGMMNFPLYSIAFIEAKMLLPRLDRGYYRVSMNGRITMKVFRF